MAFFWAGGGDITPPSIFYSWMLSKFVGLLATSDGERGRENKSPVSRDRSAPTAAAAFSPKFVLGGWLSKGGENAAPSRRDVSRLLSSMLPDVWSAAPPPGLSKEKSSVFSLRQVSDRESLRIAQDWVDNKYRFSGPVASPYYWGLFPKSKVVDAGWARILDPDSSRPVLVYLLFSQSRSEFRSSLNSWLLRLSRCSAFS